MQLANFCPNCGTPVYETKAGELEVGCGCYPIQPRLTPTITQFYILQKEYLGTCEVMGYYRNHLAAESALERYIELYWPAEIELCEFTEDQTWGYIRKDSAGKEIGRAWLTIESFSDDT